MSNERIEIGADGRKHITTEPRLNKSEDDTALLRHALDALVSAKYELVGIVTTTPALNELIAALRERLGEKA